jgi:hypothetical protein
MWFEFLQIENNCVYLLTQPMMNTAAEGRVTKKHTMFSTIMGKLWARCPHCGKVLGKLCEKLWAFVTRPSAHLTLILKTYFICT